MEANHHDHHVVGESSSAPASLPPSAGNEYDAEHAKVESFLDEHPEFLQSYLIRKGRRGMIDAWLLAHAVHSGPAISRRRATGGGDNGESNDIVDYDDEDDDEDVHNLAHTGQRAGGSRTMSSGSKASSGSGTPVRK